MSTIEDLAGRVFAARDIAHRAHWQTGSMAQHLALGEFYEELPDLIDAVVECYMGQAGAVIGDVEVKADKPADVTEYLVGESQWIESSREDICQGSPHLEALVDNLVAAYSRTIFKLERLK